VEFSPREEKGESDPLVVASPPKARANGQERLPTKGGELCAHKEAKEVTTTYDTSAPQTPLAAATQERGCQPPGLHTKKGDDDSQKMKRNQSTKPDGTLLGEGSEAAGFIDFVPKATSARNTGRELEILERYHPYPTNTPTEDIKHENSRTQQPLSKTEAASIDKRRRRQTRAKGRGKDSTACFWGNTLILVIRGDGAQWIPIWNMVKGAIVIQSLPSGSCEDL